MTGLDTAEGLRSPAAASSRRRWGRYFLGRIAEYGTVLVIALLLNFALPRALPGGPLSSLSPEAVARLTADERARLVAEYGFDKPLGTQLLDYLSGVFTLDLGRSLVDDRPVAELIGEAAPWTVLLVGTSVVLAASLGLVLGVVGALRRQRGKGAGLLGGMLIADSMPPFWVGMLLIVLFGVHLGVLPTFGASDVGGVTPAGVAEHLVLPVTTLVVSGAGQFFLYTRYAMLSVMTSEPVEHARARGVPQCLLIRRHALRPALLPAHTVLLLDIGYLAGGSVVVETVFGYPGLGRLTFTAIQSRDYPLMQGAFLMLTLMVVGMNALADATYPLLDPRARTGDRS